MSEPVSPVARIVSLSVIGVAFTAVVVAASPALRETVLHFVGIVEAKTSAVSEQKESVELIFGANDAPGLRLKASAVDGLGIKPVKAMLATKRRPLPPLIGTINFDVDRLFNIRSRFNGELMEITEVPDESSPSTEPCKRMLKYGDKFKQNDLLAVVWSPGIGQAKAALVDAVSALRLSEYAFKRQLDLMAQGATSVSAYENARRQMQGDSNSLLAAERTLRIWRLTDEEIKSIRDEANRIADLADELAKEGRNPRDAADEAQRWARVELRVPKFAGDPNRQLVVVEKNGNLGDFVDPSYNPALFKVADLSRLQIWVHPPEEYMPIIRDMLARKASARWQIRVEADPPEQPPMELEFLQVANSLEPNQHTPMVMGYLDNPGGNRYLVGQFVTATILVPPDQDTVEIPTEALNEIDGQAMVFVQPDPAKLEYVQRRVAVVRRFKDVSFVRTKLTAADQLFNKLETEKKRRPMEPLQGGELLVTRGVVELTAELEEQLTKKASK
jgi:membrane fusion protein, heavy metal efflux system